MLTLMNIQEVVRLKRVNYKSKTTNKSHFVISCRINGESSFFCDNETIPVKRGDILYIPSGSTYSQCCKEEDVIYIHFVPLAAAPDKLLFTRSEDPDAICALFLKCYREFTDKKENFLYRCMALLYEIVSHIHFEEAGNRKDNEDIFSKAVQYLNLHMHDNDFSIDALCQHTHISRTYFNRLFKRTYQLTPMVFIHHQRINKAKFLLNNGIYSNEEIARLCGFHDVKYFYVVFKKITGLTPFEYKKSQTNVI